MGSEGSSDSPSPAPTLALGCPGQREGKQGAAMGEGIPKGWGNRELLWVRGSPSSGEHLGCV